MVKNPPFSAGDAGSIPGQGAKLPHVAGQLRPRATTTELACLNQRACVLQATEPTCSEACAPQLQSPHALEPTHHTREKPEQTTCHDEKKIPHVSTKIPRAATKT